MRRTPGNAGFLLAETLITFALSALVMVGLVASAAVLMRATDRSVAAVGSADDLGRTLAALARDVSGLKRARWNGEEPQGFVFRGGPNSLFFSQEAPAPGGGRELRVVSLREIAGDHGTALMRAEAHLSATASGWSDLSFGPGRVVPTGPARLRFRYVAEAGPDGRAPAPLDSWPSGPTLPAVVIVEAVEPASTRLLVSARIGVRADGDIGCADRTSRPSGDTAPGSAPPPGQGASAQGGAAPSQAPGQGPANGASFSVADTAGVANPNEFCGRADKGIAPKDVGNQPGGDGSSLPRSIRL